MIFIPEDLEGTRWTGYVRVGNDEYKLGISNVHYKKTHNGDHQRMDLSDAEVVAEPQLASLLAQHAQILKVE